MFPSRYFPSRYFAGRYWPKHGATVVVVPDGSTSQHFFPPAPPPKPTYHAEARIAIKLRCVSWGEATFTPAPQPEIVEPEVVAQPVTVQRRPAVDIHAEPPRPKRRRLRKPTKAELVRMEDLLIVFGNHRGS